IYREAKIRRRGWQDPTDRERCQIRKTTGRKAGTTSQSVTTAAQEAAHGQRSNAQYQGKEETQVRKTEDQNLRLQGFFPRRSSADQQRDRQKTVARPRAPSGQVG